MRHYTLDMSHSAPCEHRNFRVQLTPGGPHYGKRLCLQCGAFCGWERNPEVSVSCSARDTIIDRLLRDGVSEWERSFLNSIRGKRWLSPKQLSCFEKIHAESR